MSAVVLIEETAKGWDVTVTDGDNVLIRTEGDKIYVSVAPDDDDKPSPLDVTLK